MIIRAILPTWAKDEYPTLPKVLEGDFSEQQIATYNKQFYNIYYLPNCPSFYTKGTVIDGTHIDTFRYVFVDMDLKEGKHASKEEFIDKVLDFPLIPSAIVDSGNGVHVYWEVTDLDAMNFLRLQRRLCRKLKTDEAVSKIYQLMRMPGTLNTKRKEVLPVCEILYSTDNRYTCEELDRNLPPISPADEEYSISHYNKTFNVEERNKTIDTAIPAKFAFLLRNNREVKEIWSGGLADRSKGDYRLAHIMFADGFTKDEATSVLANSSKALQRSPQHQINYAMNIVDKIWLEMEGPEPDSLSQTVGEIISTAGDRIKGTPFRCHSYIDATEHGFRLGQVIGLVAGSGVGKTAMALNMFEGFVKTNPEYDHFFIPLEQPVAEIADRWKELCGDNTRMHDKVHLISNYGKNGEFRHLSFDDIKEYILKFKEKTGKKIGCVVIDHIGALKKKNAKGENQDLMDICHTMKAFALETNTLLVMQSQAPREKAGSGDLELNKDAAYGTVYFESYCDYLVCIWQPLKRCYDEEACPTVTAFKFAKIRHKKQHLDAIKEDVRYLLSFDSSTGRMRELTQDEEKAFEFFNNKAVNKRKLDRKTDVLSYTSITWTKDEKGAA